MELISDPNVKSVFNNYPEFVQGKIIYLRSLLIKVASGIKGLDSLEETLKWGEPSYLTKNGSTVRMDWKEKTPEQYALYFKCTSSLVPTFRTIYNNSLSFEGMRAIVFKIDEVIPEKELKHCITMALTYHKIKHLPLLGTITTSQLIIKPAKE